MFPPGSPAAEPYWGNAKDLPREVSVSKIVVSVIGLDCPGVVYAVSSTLSALECNIEEVSQTILKNQFAAIFVANKQESLDNGTIHTQLSKAIEARGMHLSVTIRDFEEGDTFGSAESEPFVVTVDGEDRFEIIAAFSKIFADQKVNIENLKALMPEEEKRALLVFEISLPMEIDRNALRRTLKDPGPPAQHAAPRHLRGPAPRAAGLAAIRGPEANGNLSPSRRFPPRRRGGSIRAKNKLPGGSFHAYRS